MSRLFDDTSNCYRFFWFQAILGKLTEDKTGFTFDELINEMIAYLHYVKPRKAELIVDEMLAICSDIDVWKKKKAVEEANARYNEMLYYGIGGGED